MTSRSKRRSAPKLSSSRDKVRAHRKRLRARGLRPIQVWVPDTRTAAFKVEAHRQSQVVATKPACATGPGFYRCDVTATG